MRVCTHITAFLEDTCSLSSYSIIIQCDEELPCLVENTYDYFPILSTSVLHMEYMVLLQSHAKVAVSTQASKIHDQLGYDPPPM